MSLCVQADHSIIFQYIRLVAINFESNMLIDSVFLDTEKVSDVTWHSALSRVLSLQLPEGERNIRGCMLSPKAEAWEVTLSRTVA
jgi:hypothetical protein